jgi:hypothetical protein
MGNKISSKFKNKSYIAGCILRFEYEPPCAVIDTLITIKQGTLCIFLDNQLYGKIKINDYLYVITDCIMDKRNALTPVKLNGNSVYNNYLKFLTSSVTSVNSCKLHNVTTSKKKRFYVNFYTSKGVITVPDFKCKRIMKL